MKVDASRRRNDPRKATEKTPSSPSMVRLSVSPARSTRDPRSVRSSRSANVQRAKRLRRVRFTSASLNGEGWRGTVEGRSCKSSSRRVWGQRPGQPEAAVFSWAASRSWAVLSSGPGASTHASPPWPCFRASPPCVGHPRVSSLNEVSCATYNLSEHRPNDAGKRPHPRSPGHTLPTALGQVSHPQGRVKDGMHGPPK